MIFNEKYDAIIALAKRDEQFADELNKLFARLDGIHKIYCQEGVEFSDEDKDVYYEHNERGYKQLIYPESYLIVNDKGTNKMLEICNVNQDWLDNLERHTNCEVYADLENAEIFYGRTDILRLDITNYKDESNEEEDNIHTYMLEIVNTEDGYYLYFSHQIEDENDTSYMDEDVWYMPISYEELVKLTNLPCKLIVDQPTVKIKPTNAGV